MGGGGGSIPQRYLVGFGWVLWLAYGRGGTTRLCASHSTYILSQLGDAQHGLASPRQADTACASPSGEGALCWRGIHRWGGTASRL